MNSVQAATLEPFGAIRQLRRVEPASAPPAEQLQRRLRDFLDAMRERLKREGCSQDDVQDILYALVALADEVALNLGEPVSTGWMGNPLQYHYFRENTAGEGFFDRLSKLRRDRARGHVLWVYAMCLSLGFQGRYRVRGGELELLNLVDELHRELGPPPVDIDVLAPDGERPDERLVRARTNLPLVLASVGILVIGVLVFAGLRFDLSRRVDRLRAATTVQAKAP